MKLAALLLVLAAWAAGAGAQTEPALVLHALSARARQAVTFRFTGAQLAAQDNPSFSRLTPAQWAGYLPATLAVATAIEGRGPEPRDVLALAARRARIRDGGEILLVVVRFRSLPKGPSSGPLAALEIPLLADGTLPAWELADGRRPWMPTPEFPGAWDRLWGNFTVLGPP